MASIELQNVTVKIGNNILLDNVSLKVDDGAYIGLLGPSNGGPSFVLKVIAGLLPIYSGKIFIDEVDVTDSHPEDRNVGFIFEQFNLFPHLTVLDNILYGPRVKGIDLTTKEREAKEVISMVRLENRESALSKELSGGMQQRTGIARAITAGAKILLLDQPYRALDAKIREEMRFEIRELVKELGMTAIHSTHETEEAMLTSDKIAVFNEGKLLQFDNPETVYKIPVNAFVAGFLAESNKFQVKVKDNSFIIENSKFIV
ncbi:MAG: ABC transporter ATP-binding protein, partial [Candidatus Heimdallarchaeota archaeon]|nr:ABC transporter ATP-binding protein [Candidatus Heimdallarchaeota archaeon]